MFQNLMNIIKIDMSEFKSSSVTDMSYMFSGCESSTIINLIIILKYFWYYSFINKRLEELNLNNLATNSVIDMRRMFYNFKSLTTLNLNSFKINNLKHTNLMFYGCSSLLSLNLYNFNASGVTCLYNMFYGCSSLLYLNIYNCKFNSSSCVYSNIFTNCNKNLK